MKKTLFLIWISTLFVLTGCWSKSYFQLSFDQFNIKIYDNNKIYETNVSETDIEGMKILREMKEQTSIKDTGFINSLFVVQTSIISGTKLKELVDANSKQLQIKLLKYEVVENIEKNVQCDILQYTWYITAFSYVLWQEKLYDAQYYLHNNDQLYVISLSSDNDDDINRFIKSIRTVTCTK